jgi:aminoglycoside phosphotransferase (APT) family kinase protein
VTTSLPGLAAAAFDDWLRRELPELASGGDWHAEVIAGGLSNITYRVEFPHRTVILRRPPLGHILPSAHDMAREYRVLQALAPTDVPVPKALRMCSDPAVLGQPFYVMDEIVGDILRTSADTDRLTEAQRADATGNFIQTLATLHSLEPGAVGLADYGRPDGYCSRQIGRWGTQWDLSHTRSLPDMDTLLNKLSESVPASPKSSIVHGDYRMDNVMVEPANAFRVAAVLDWELSTLGDPLADLGLTLTYWHDEGDAERAQIPVAVGITDKAGFPTARELAQTYAELTGTDLANMGFYLAFGAMKLAVILEGVHARYLGGQTVGPGYDSAGQSVPVLVARGLRHLKQASLPAPR